MTELQIEFDIDANAEQLLSFFPSLSPNTFAGGDSSNGWVSAVSSSRFRVEPADGSIHETEKFIKAVEAGTLPFSILSCSMFIAPVVDISWAIEFTGAPANNNNFWPPSFALRARTSTIQSYLDFLVGGTPAETAANFESTLRLYLGPVGATRIASPFAERDSVGAFVDNYDVTRDGAIVTVRVLGSGPRNYGPASMTDRFSIQTGASPTITNTTVTLNRGDTSLGTIVDLAVP